MFSYYPTKIGDYVSVGAGSILEAASVGNGVEIGNNCIIVCRPNGPPSGILTWEIQGAFAIIKDCAKIADNSVVAPGTVVPSLCEWGGSPGSSPSPIPSPTY